MQEEQRVKDIRDLKPGSEAGTVIGGYGYRAFFLCPSLAIYIT